MPTIPESSVSESLEEENLRLYICLENHMSKLHKFSVHVTCGHGLILLWQKFMRYILPALWMTSCFPSMGHMAVSMWCHAAASSHKFPMYLPGLPHCLTLWLYTMAATCALGAKSALCKCLVITALRRDADIIFLPCGLFYLSLFFFLCSSFSLSRCRLDVYYTSTHGVALVQILNAGLKCAACSSLKIQESTGCKKSPKIRHLGTVAQLCRAISSQVRHISTIGKKNLLNSNIPPRPYSMVNFVPLAAEIGSSDWSTPANFNGFHVLAVLLHGTVVVGVSQALQRWTEGATYFWQGGHHVGHWPTF